MGPLLFSTAIRAFLFCARPPRYLFLNITPNVWRETFKCCEIFQVAQREIWQKRQDYWNGRVLVADQRDTDIILDGPARMLRDGGNYAFWDARLRQDFQDLAFGEKSIG